MSGNFKLEGIISLEEGLSYNPNFQTEPKIYVSVLV